jgi:phosphoglycolate phosphatase-like HAD superfamily hydrolase
MRFVLSDALASHRGVIFDLDGTLVDLPVDWDGLRLRLRDHWTNLGVEPAGIGIREGLNAVESQLGCCSLKSSFEIIREFELASVSRAVRHESILDSVKACADRGQRLAVFSANMTETVESALALVDLKDAFQLIVGGDQVRRRKPHPEGIRRILERWRLEPTDVAYVADGDHETVLAHQVGVHLFQVGLS